jgi:hypothetical protein
MQAARTLHPSAEVDGAVERLTMLLGHRVGDKFRPEKLAAIRKEGEDRYLKKIPPGYKDSKKDSGEFDKFGDLIIWKEIIDKAKLEKRPVIFISDDAKEDWWWIHRGRKMGPRPELIEEFSSESQQNFHIYEFSQFLRFAAERFPEIKANVAQVEESLLADEQARRRQDNIATLEQETRLRSLEDERDQIVGALSGTPGRAMAIPFDPLKLRTRLDEINQEIRAFSESTENEATMDDGNI